MNRVVYVTEFGGPSVLRLVDEPVPEPGPGQVRVRMVAAGLNPVDYKMRRGGSAYELTLPSPLGRELAGVVDATGPGTERLGAGAEVFGTIPLGALADFVLAEERLFAFKPEELPWEVAGGLALAGQTAWDALASQQLARGDTIVVSAAAGGVGGILCQLAVRAGIRVIGTASPANHDWLRSRGVEPIEYGPGLVERLRGVAPQGITAGFDLHGEESVRQFVEFGIPADRVNTNAVPGELLGVRHVGRGPADLSTLGTLASLVVAGDVVVPIEARFALGDVRRAFERLESQHLRGKVVALGAAAEERGVVPDPSEPAGRA